MRQGEDARLHGRFIRRGEAHDRMLQEAQEWGDAKASATVLGEVDQQKVCTPVLST